MANEFFQNFPNIEYTLNDGKVISIKDFFRKSKIETEALDSIVAYTYYEIQDGERPDVVATKLYGNGDLHWKLFLANEFTNYNEWHMDNDVQGKHQPPVRKISMTLLLSDPSTFEGGELEIMSKGKTAKLKQGQAMFFASWLQHRVKPVTKGERKSLVMWFGGPSFK